VECKIVPPTTSQPRIANSTRVQYRATAATWLP
jgi:hypothetical protein